MAALYGIMIAVPMVWTCAGYALVSRPGTAEPTGQHATKSESF